MNRSGRPKTAIPIEGDLTHSQAGESYARLTEGLLSRGKTSHQVLVTSASDGEGKTVTAVNLAFAFHARRIPVLLAELSFARPHFQEVFGPSPFQRGMENVMREGLTLQSIVCVRNDNNLNVAMVKQRQPTNDLLLPGKYLDQLLSDARSTYDWTIFDGPSVESTSDIRAIAASVGLVLLVARARQTHAARLQEAITRIAHPHTFVVLNDA